MQVKPVKVPVQQRYCKLCDLGAVEDEDHFLLVCPAYQSVATNCHHTFG
jgi:hypothetical protein